jgi:hypothetical protein
MKQIRHEYPYLLHLWYSINAAVHNQTQPHIHHTVKRMTPARQCIAYRDQTQPNRHATRFCETLETLNATGSDAIFRNYVAGLHVQSADYVEPILWSTPASQKSIPSVLPGLRMLYYLQQPGYSTTVSTAALPLSNFYRPA